MKNLMKWTPFEKGLLAINVIIIMISFILAKDFGGIAFAGLVSSISNTVCVILCARREISNYIWGVLAVVSYAFVSYMYMNTGEFMLNAFYYFPMQFVGLWLWLKHKDKSDAGKVESKQMSLKTSAIVYSLTLIGILGYAWLISLPSFQMVLYGEVSNFGFYKYLIDSFTTISSVTAMILMVLRFKEQWYLWVVIDIVTISLWFITFNPLMIIQWATMLANAIHGIQMWKVQENQ